MSDSANSAPAAAAPNAAAPAAVTPDTAAPAAPATEAAKAPSKRQTARDSVAERKAAKEARRSDPNREADMWKRAGEKAAAKEAAKTGKAPAEAAPAKDPETGRFLPRDGGAPAAAEPAKTAAAEPAKAEPAAEPAKAIPADREGKQKLLADIAKDLGLRVDAGAVTSTERYQLRQERREALQKLDQRRAQDLADVAKEREAIGEEAKQAKAFAEALKAGDPDALAAAAGHKDWNSLQEALLEAVSDPHYARIKALEAEREAEKKEREEAKKRFEQQQVAQERARANNELRQGVASQAKGSSDTLLKACADDPIFIETLIGRQAHHYDPVTETTCTLEEALDDVLPNGMTLRAIMKAKFERLAQVFGSAPAAPAAQAPAARPAVQAAPAPAPAPVAVERRPAHTRRHSVDDDLIRKYEARMKTG